MHWANRKTCSLLTPVMGIGFLIPYVIGMAVGQTHAMVLYAGFVTGWFFTLCLAMTPLNIIWGIRGGQEFKKPFGLFAFVYAVLHGFAYLVDESCDLAAFAQNGVAVTGALATLIMLPLALTSTSWAMRKMGKNWKRMQRMVYLAAILIAAHMLMDGLPFGLVILALLVVRIPPVRRYLVQRRGKFRHEELASL
jgi:sulfoxide reductase heme-binding subunit YedZ